jgi:hypothetical protein
MGGYMSRTKFNVDRDNSDRTYDGITFDSKVEMWYYRDVVLPGVESGDIESYELQKAYELQPKFEHDGTTVRPIEYVADFYIRYADGREEVIDIKGFPDAVAKLKRKLFWYVYPEITYKWLSFVKKYDGWIEYDERARRKRAEKKMNKKENAENG